MIAAGVDGGGSKIAPGLTCLQIEKGPAPLCLATGGGLVKVESHRILEGPYFRDILNQPQALQATLEEFRGDADLFHRIGQVRQTGHARMVLTGMGS